MHLARLRLDPAGAQARRDLSDPYDMHRTLARAFALEDEPGLPRFLWRLEPVQDWARPELLVSALRPGDWSFLQAEAGYLRAQEDSLVTREVDLSAAVQAGVPYRFRLAANPTVTRGGKRLGLVGEDAQLEWLHRQGERHGFQVQAALVCGHDMLHGRRAGGRVSLLRVLYEGVLQVQSVPAVQQALRTGIGPGKAFGCGLLSLSFRV